MAPASCHAVSRTPGSFRIVAVSVTDTVDALNSDNQRALAREEHLDGDAALGPGVLGFVDGAHAALAERAPDAVTFVDRVAVRDEEVARTVHQQLVELGLHVAIDPERARGVMDDATEGERPPRVGRVDRARVELAAAARRASACTRGMGSPSSPMPSTAMRTTGSSVVPVP
jgi:hypothetical protein